MDSEELHVSTIVDDLATLYLLDVVLTVERGETPLLGDDDLLLTGELVTGTTEGLDNNSLVGVLGTDGNKHLANVDTGGQASGLTPGVTHTLLQTIGTSTRQHLVDTEDVERVDTNAHVEGLTTRHLGDVLVASDTSGLQGLGGQLLELVRHKVDAERELTDRGTLTAQVERTDLGVRNGTVVTALREGLVLAVAVATCGSACHFVKM